MRKRNGPQNPARYLVGGFLGVILAGSLLLMLPQSSSGSPPAYLDALFTATSAVCVTGLVVVDTGTFYSPFGQVVIMLLIFVGSLGFMTMATLIFIFLGRRITLQDKLVVREALNRDSLTEVAALVKAVVRMAVLFELAGALLLSFRFIPELGWGKGALFSLFHSVSAFGNAGFDLFGGFQSLAGRPTDYLVNGTILGLFILGGLGYPVIFNIVENRREPRRFTLHTRMVLIISSLLLAAGTGAVLVLEWGNPATLGPLDPFAKIFGALFTAATPRTAGFSVVETGLLHLPTAVLLLALMFVGASPASTGGGVKTTTVGAVFIAFTALLRGRQEPVVFLKRIPFSQIFRAVAIIGWAAVLVFFTTLILSLSESQPFQAILFEAVSAFGTVGLSYGITPDLSPLGKLIIIFTMFSGRLGPLTMLLALAHPHKEEGLHYPEEKLLIG